MRPRSLDHFLDRCEIRLARTEAVPLSWIAPERKTVTEEDGVVKQAAPFAKDGKPTVGATPVIYTPQPPSPMVNDWVDRHRDPRSFTLHLLGIPGTILGVLLIPVYTMLMSPSVFGFALALFLGGFVLQFLGHALDGTEPGEIKGIRAWWARRREAKAASGRVPVGFPDAKTT